MLQPFKERRAPPKPAVLEPDYSTKAITYTGVNIQGAEPESVSSASLSRFHKFQTTSGPTTSECSAHGEQLASYTVVCQGLYSPEGVPLLDGQGPSSSRLIPISSSLPQHPVTPAKSPHLDTMARFDEAAHQEKKRLFEQELEPAPACSPPNKRQKTSKFGQKRDGVSAKGKGNTKATAKATPRTNVGKGPINHPKGNGELVWTEQWHPPHAPGGSHVRAAASTNDSNEVPTPGQSISLAIDASTPTKFSKASSTDISRLDHASLPRLGTAGPSGLSSGGHRGPDSTGLFTPRATPTKRRRNNGEERELREPEERLIKCPRVDRDGGKADSVATVDRARASSPAVGTSSGPRSTMALQTPTPAASPMSKSSANAAYRF